MKNKLMVSFLALVLVACGSSGGSLELSKQEKEQIKGDVNTAKLLLLQKAILKEASTEKLTEEEKYTLNLAKQEVEVNYYLQRKLNSEVNNIQVSEDEAKQYYDTYKAQLGIENIPYEQVKEAIAQQIFIDKQNAMLTKYYQDLADKYKIDEILKKDFPDAVAQPVVESQAPATEAAPAETKTEAPATTEAPTEEAKTEEKK